MFSYVQSLVVAIVYLLTASVGYTQDTDGTKLGTIAPVVPSETITPQSGPEIPTVEPKPKIAYVLSGGGAKGSFEVGVLKRFYESELRPSIVAGTSVGAINAIKLVEGTESSFDELLAIWQSLAVPTDMYVKTDFMSSVEELIDEASYLALDLDGGESVFWPLFKLDQLMTLISVASSADDLSAEFGQVHSLYSLAPIRQKLASHLDLDRVMSSGIELRQAVVDLHSGSVCYTREDGRLCCQSECSPVDLLDATMASAGIPVIFEPVKLAGRYFTDGGVREIVPLLEVIEGMKADTVFVVLARPWKLESDRNFLVTEGAADAEFNVLDVGTRTLDILTYDVFFNDLLVALGIDDWPNDFEEYFDKDIFVISPKFQVHDTMEVDPFLINYNIDYGWMLAADTLRARANKDETLSAWRVAFSGVQTIEDALQEKINRIEGVALDKAREAISQGQYGQYLDYQMSPLERQKKLFDIASDIIWLRHQALKAERLVMDEDALHHYSESGPGRTSLTGAGIERLRRIKRLIAQLIEERRALGGEIPDGNQDWYRKAEIKCINCVVRFSATPLSEFGWIWDAYPTNGIPATAPPQ